MNLKSLKDKRILILGFGQEGRDTFRFLKKLFPKKILGIADQKLLNSTFGECQKDVWGKRVKLHLGENYLKALKKYDIIIKSPGIPLKILPKSALKKITSQTEIFFENCPGTIIGITGTKGKSTTTFLIYKILKEGGKRVHLIGNIGRPVLNLLFKASSKDIWVYELSSFQLQTLKKSPHIAIFLNIYPEHLDYHQNFNEYLKAKQNITKYQKKEDYFIYNFNDPLVRATSNITKAKKIPIKNYSDILKNVGISKIPLLGKHNLLNIAAAIKVAEIFKIPKKKIKKAIDNFKALPHRLEYIGTFRGIRFYNDSLSTIPEATIAALNCLANEVETLFVGGFDRGINFQTLAKAILKSKIKNLILFPTTGEKIWKEIIKISPEKGKRKIPIRHFFVNNMGKAVRLAYQHTRKGKICLLSCASPSFNLFRNYKERGNLFKRYVKKYAKY